MNVLTKKPWILPHEVYGVITSFLFLLAGGLQIRYIIGLASSDEAYRALLQAPFLQFVVYCFSHWLFVYGAQWCTRMIMRVLYEEMTIEKIKEIQKHWNDENFNLWFLILPLLFHMGLLMSARYIWVLTIRIFIKRFNYGYKPRILHSNSDFFIALRLEELKDKNRYQRWKDLYRYN